MITEKELSNKVAEFILAQFKLGSKLNVHAYLRQHAKHSEYDRVELITEAELEERLKEVHGFRRYNTKFNTSFLETVVFTLERVYFSYDLQDRVTLYYINRVYGEKCVTLNLNNEPRGTSYKKLR